MATGSADKKSWTLGQFLAPKPAAERTGTARDVTVRQWIFLFLVLAISITIGYFAGFLWSVVLLFSFQLWWVFYLKRLAKSRAEESSN